MAASSSSTSPNARTIGWVLRARLPSKRPVSPLSPVPVAILDISRPPLESRLRVQNLCEHCRAVDKAGAGGGKQDIGQGEDAALLHGFHNFPTGPLVDLCRVLLLRNRADPADPHDFRVGLKHARRLDRQGLLGFVAKEHPAARDPDDVDHPALAPRRDEGPWPPLPEHRGPRKALHGALDAAERLTKGRDERAPAPRYTRGAGDLGDVLQYVLDGLRVEVGRPFRVVTDADNLGAKAEVVSDLGIRRGQRYDSRNGRDLAVRGFRRRGRRPQRPHPAPNLR